MSAFHTRVLLTVLFTSLLIRFEEPAKAGVAYVSPQGSDLVGVGTEEEPFKTIGYALGQLSGDPDMVIELLPGTYSPEENGEGFPLHLEPEGTLTIRGPPEEKAILRGTGEDGMLLVGFRSGSRPVVRLERLQIEGGLSGIMAVGERGSEFTIEILGNRFTGQPYQCVEVVAGENGIAKAVIRENVIDGAAVFGVDLATRPGGALEIEIQDNRIEDATPLPVGGYGPSPEPIRFALATYLDLGSKLLGIIDRNIFLNVSTGILVLEEDLGGDLGEVDLQISNCLIAGDSSPEKNRLLHGFYLGLHPRARTKLRILNNTVVNALGYGICQVEPVDFSENEDNVDLAVSRCIFWNNELGEFSAESRQRPLPVYYREVRANILPTSSRKGVDGNLSVDPGFRAGYELAVGSPAVDAGDVPAGLSMDGDARNACRVADGNGDGIYRIDLGALELAGPCLRDSRPFLRGDCDRNMSLQVTDAIRLFEYLFLGASSPVCLDACDCDDDGMLYISDGIYLLAFTFTGGPIPASPFPEPGFDHTPDALGACR